MKEIAYILRNRQARKAVIRDRWKQIRWSDALPIVFDIARGRTTEVGGAAVRSLETRFKKLTGCAHALAMNSGTAALHSAYWAVGVSAGDEVIVPSYTFFATATPLIQLGAVPIMCEIDPDTLTADPVDVEARITPRTRALCVVHVWGNPAPMDKFVELARRYRLRLIEDCSHAPGATYRGKAVGSFGDVGCFSLQGAKAVSGGEAGIAVTNSGSLFDRMLALGHNGRTSMHNVTGESEIGPLSYGMKFRPHLFAVRIACRTFDRLETLNRLRARTWGRLSKILADTGVLVPIKSTRDGERGGYLQFVFRYLPEKCGGWTREAFVKALQAEGVPVEIDRYSFIGENYHFLHQAPIFSSKNAESISKHLPPLSPILPITERVCSHLISFPAFTQVKDTELEKIGAAVSRVAQSATEFPDLRLSLAI